VAEPALRDFLKKKGSAEVTERVHSLLRGLVRVSSPDALRHLRAMQVLETIGSADAHAILKSLAAGAATARERQEATAALERLSERMLFPARPTRISPEDVEIARRIIDKALKAHGGAETLARLSAVTGEQTGKSYRGFGEPREYTVEFAYQPPLRSWSSSRTKGNNGKDFVMTSARDGDRDWSRIGTHKGFTPPESKDEVREGAYASWIIMLYPLADRSIPIAPLGKSQVNGRPALGVVVTAKGHRPIKLFFDEQTGLLVKDEIRSEEYRGGESTYETIYDDYQTIDGIKCAMREKILKDGKLVGESHITKLKRSEKLDDKLFVEPP
jgi:hypothetical protein